tara:strand:+ start:2099 stop:2533 length:435 start_codon:yes stop_codon:yes gene_type:complete
MGMDKIDNIRLAATPAAINNSPAGQPGTNTHISKQSSAQVHSGQSAKPISETNLKTTNLAKSLAEDVKVNEEKVREAVAEINNELVKLQSELGFSVDKVAKNNVVVTVKRKETGEVVRQIPSESILKLAHSFERLKGVLMDELF